VIEGSRVRLRGLELADLDVIMLHWNNLELRNLVISADRGPIPRCEEEEWLRAKWKQRQERKAYAFAIETVADQRMIGTTELSSIDWTSRSAVFGISIFDKENQGKGYGMEAANLILDYAFRTLNLHRIELETLDINERAQRCYRSVGFKEVGRKRKARYVDGEYRDGVLMDLLRDEWQPARDQRRLSEQGHSLRCDANTRRRSLFSA
jgi:RimJ/RimL family protein N-acetyltransferase